MTHIVDPDFCYEVGSYKFYNKIAAADYAVRTNQQIKFNLYDRGLASADWLVEPPASWDRLLDLRAQQIAAKGLPIVLFFSGGTDSLTIYKVFERNKIKIHAVYLQPHASEIETFEKVFEFLGKINSPDTRIIIGEEKKALTLAYNNENWVWEKGLRLQFKLVGMGDEDSMRAVEQALDIDDFIGIIGLEKPRLHFDSSGVYSYQVDENYMRPMADHRLKCFYISPELPELHIKQSYMLLRYIKTIAGKHRTPATLRNYNNIHNPLKFSWLKYSIDGCGRYGDLNSSDIPHSRNNLTKLEIPQGEISKIRYQGRFARVFEDIRGTKEFSNYLRGIMGFAQSPSGKYLLEGRDDFFGTRQFRSMMHKMSFGA